MKRLARLLSYVGLGLTLVPSLFTFAGMLPARANNVLMMIGTLLWFSTALVWIRRDQDHS